MSEAISEKYKESDLYLQNNNSILSWTYKII